MHTAMCMHTHPNRSCRSVTRPKSLMLYRLQNDGLTQSLTTQQLNSFGILSYLDFPELSQWLTRHCLTSHVLRQKLESYLPKARWTKYGTWHLNNRMHLPYKGRSNYPSFIQTMVQITFLKPNSLTLAMSSAKPNSLTLAKGSHVLFFQKT